MMGILGATSLTILNDSFKSGSTNPANMEEAQARRLGIKVTDGKNRYFAHTLNNTVIATSRAMVAILENNQNKDGSVTIPKVLMPYMGGIKKIGPIKKKK